MTPELKAALDRLDLAPISVFVETDDFIAVSATSDPATELRKFKSMNPRIRGVALQLYFDNEVVARRVMARALEKLTQAGVRVDGRFLGCTPQRFEAMAREIAAGLGCEVYSAADRLVKAQAALDQLAKRAGV